MNALRTPDERFLDLKDYPFLPNYIETLDGLRIHYLDEGPKDGQIVLMMHGEPTWSYLYRKMIPIVVAAGYRVIAPDLIGFGKSDKPDHTDGYSYKKHVDWITYLIQQLDLQNITLVCQDWGGLIGLRIAAENAERFQRIVASNTGMPTGDQPPSQAFLKWQESSQTMATFPVGNLVNFGCVNKLTEAEIAAYDAPFPDESYKAGARIFPKLVPTSPDDPASEANRAAWGQLMAWKKPFLTCFADTDPITRHGDKVLQQLIPGTKGQNHTEIKQAGHFVQEDKGEEWANLIVTFIQNN